MESRKTKKVIEIIFVTVTIVMTVFAGMTSADKVTARDWSDWEYSKIVYIKENSGETLIDYQVLVNLSGNFTTGANPDGRDIRFVDADENELSYWIEEFDATNERGAIWVKVPEIPADETAYVWMYYGNPDASAMSNGCAVFEFFDDSEIWNLDKWDISVNGEVPYGAAASDKHSGSYSRYVGPSSCPCDCWDSYTVSFTWNESVNLPSNSYNFSYWRREPYDWGGSALFFINDIQVFSDCGGCNNRKDTGWYQKNFIYTGAITGLMIREWDITNRESIYFDDFYVRKYTDPEPTVTISPTPKVKICTDKTTYIPADMMTITIDIANPTEDSVTFQWYWIVPQFSVCVPVMSSPIPAGYKDTLDFNFTIPDWGPTPFGNLFYVQLLDASGEILDADDTCWAYSPSGVTMPVAEIDIEKEIKKIIGGIEWPS